MPTPPSDLSAFARAALPRYAGLVLAFAVAVVLTGTAAGAQAAPSRAATSVRVTADTGAPGAGAPPLARVLTAADLAALPHDTVTAAAHGPAARYAGVRLAAVLQAAGAWPGGAAATGEHGGLRGAGLARYVVVTASDGYRAVFALAELDPATGGGPAPLLADRAGGAPLAAADGPLRVVAPGDRRPARWVRGVVALDVRAAAPAPR